MRHFILIGISLIMAMLLVSGCASIDVCSLGNDMVVVQNSGIYLLYAIPVISGDPDCPNQKRCVLFTDTLTLHNNVALLEEEVERLGASGYRNLASHLDEEAVFFFLLSRKVYKTSAELIR